MATASKSIARPLKCRGREGSPALREWDAANGESSGPEPGKVGCVPGSASNLGTWDKSLPLYGPVAHICITIGFTWLISEDLLSADL